MTYSREEFEKAKGKILSKLLLPYISPAEEPQAFLIVGQPGAGKTTMARIFTSQLEKNVIFISGDEYRRFHPRFSDLIKQYGDEAVLHTQEFAGKMTEALIDELSSRKYNLIIEGTLRTVEVPAKTKFQLERRGYDVTMAAILVRPEVSYLSTIKRYQRMQKIGSVPRKTPKNHHDLVVSAIAKNIGLLHRTKEFPHIQVYNRQGDRLCDTMETPDINPGDIFKNEFERPLSQQERDRIVKDFAAYVPKDRILAVMDEYKGASTLSHPMERGQGK